MLPIPGFLKFCSSRNLTSRRNNGERNGPPEGYSAIKCDFEDLRRCTNSRCLTRRIRSQQKLLLLDVVWQCPNYSVLFSCSISFAESVVTCLRNKAYVYLISPFVVKCIKNRQCQETDQKTPHFHTHVSLTSIVNLVSCIVATESCV